MGFLKVLASLFVFVWLFLGGPVVLAIYVAEANYLMAAVLLLSLAASLALVLEPEDNEPQGAIQ